jgi:hypothetical protein
MPAYQHDLKPKSSDKVDFSMHWVSPEEIAWPNERFEVLSPSVQATESLCVATTQLLHAMMGVLISVPETPNQTETLKITKFDIMEL